MSVSSTWEERTGGIQFTDSLDRVIRVQVSRFHGPVVSVDGKPAYLGDNAPALINYLKENI